MPGDRALLEDFASSLSPGLLGDLFREIVSEMRFAGDLGSLLKIERKLAGTIATARKAFVEYQTRSAQQFLPDMAPEAAQAELDLSGIDEVRFFEEAEARL